MSEWQKVKIGDFLHRQKKSVQLDSEQEYALVTIRVKHKGVQLREMKKGAQIGSKMYQIKKGQFILSGIDARQGAFGIVPDELDGAIVTNDFWAFEVDENIVKRDFFYWLTTTPLFLDSCIKSSKGETQRIRLQKDAFYSFEFSFPPIEKQSEFLKRLQIIDSNTSALAKENTNQQTYLTQLRQAILQEAIEGKLTADWRVKNPVQKGNPDHDAQALLETIKAEKQKLIADGKIKKEKPLAPINPDDVPFALPDGWVWVRLGEIASIVRGGSPRPAGDKTYYDGHIPFLKVGDLTRDNEIFLNSHTHSIKEAGLYKTRFVEANTLMLTNSGATLGVPKICTFPTTFNDGIAAFLGIEDLNKVFFYYLLKLKTKWFLNEAARGQGQPNLNTEIIGNTVFALPPLSEQNAIVERVDRFLNQVNQLEIQFAECKDYAQQFMQSVLAEAFTS